MEWKDCVSDTTNNVATLQCLPMVFGFIINWLLVFAGVVALVFVIMSGIKYITAGGDQKKLDAAKKTLTYAALGLVIIFVSFIIIRIVGYVTGANCINSFGFNCT
jgi:heme O synthase-like polyprenyltransferase